MRTDADDDKPGSEQYDDELSHKLARFHSLISCVEVALENLIVFRRVPIAKEILRLGHLNDDLARHQPADAC